MSGSVGLEEMCQQLEDVLARQASAPPGAPAPIGTTAALLSTPWIVRWLDYSKRYGLGYELSDGTTGALLNDGSMVAAPPACSFIWHWDREAQPALRIHRDHHGERSAPGIAAFGLLEGLIRSQLQGLERPLTSTRRSVAEYLLAPPSRPVSWLRLPGATVFRYNTSVLQVDFADNTRLVVDFSAGVVALGDDMSQVAPLLHYTFDMIAISACHPVLIARLTFLVELLRQHVRVYDSSYTLAAPPPSLTSSCASTALACSSAANSHDVSARGGPGATPRLSAATTGPRFGRASHS